MKIQHIYISAYIHDLRLTCCCVASIRYWYPDIPITLVKDDAKGVYSTEEVEKYWQVDSFYAPKDMAGWGWSNLIPLFRPPGERCLVLDSDIVFIGKVLDVLEECEEDFVVAEEAFAPPAIEENFFTLDKLHDFDPDFVFPGYAFNAGQLVVTTGLLKEEDFTPFAEFTVPPKAKYPEVFRYTVQGMVNYVLMKKHQQGEITLTRKPFMVWRQGREEEFKLRRVGKNSPYKMMIHWAGPKKPLFLLTPRGRFLRHFEGIYYSRIPHGRWLRTRRTVARLWGLATGKIPMTRYA